MGWLMTPYALILFITAIISGLVLIFAWQNNHNALSRAFIQLMSTIIIWATCAGVSTISSTLSEKIFWAKLEQIGVVSIAPIFFIFALIYAHRQNWLSNISMLHIWAIPCLALLAALTNDWHHLYWQQLILEPSNNLLLRQYGPIFWAFLIYSLVASLAANILILLNALNAPKLYRRQGLLITLGSLFPWIGAIIYSTQMNPYPGFDFIPILLCPTTLIFSWAIFRHQILSLSPIARDAIIEKMNDGMIVVDKQKHILDINPTACQILGLSAVQVIGTLASQLEIWPVLSQLNLDAHDNKTESRFQAPSGRWLEVRLSSLSKSNSNDTIWMYIFQDISERYKTEEALRQNEENFRKLFEVNPFPLTISRVSDGGAILANQSALDFFEITQDDLQKSNTSRFYKSEEQHKKLQRDLQDTDRITNQIIEFQVGEQTKWGIANAYPIQFQGETCLIIGWADITERQQTERKLSETLRALESTAVHAGQLALLADTRATEAETLRQAGVIVSSSLDQKEIIERLLEQVVRVVPFDSASVQLREGEESVVVGGAGFEDLSVIIGLRFKIDHTSPTEAVYNTGKPLILPDAQASYDTFRRSMFNQIRSWMGVPLKVQDQVIGIISFDSHELDRYHVHHSELALAFSAQVGLAIQNAKLFNETQRLATSDPLTGLVNRRHFFTLMEREFERSRRYKHELSIIMLDIDHFKRINDTYGHPAGDQVLRTLARICTQAVRNLDIVGRYGGEEFVILLPETPANRALTVAERLRTTIETTPFTLPSGDIHITVSLGVHTLNSNDGDVDNLVFNADAALYAAKAAGRNRVCASLPQS
jgi:diguanylate cyclase (GGDEF)-like protein/PAS domain S-box-containing protein